MSTIKVVSMTGAEVGSVELNDAIFGIEPNMSVVHEVVKVDPELNMLVVRGAIPGPKYSLVTVKNTVKVHKVKQAGAGISSNPQKASGRNPQKASARNK